MLCNCNCILFSPVTFIVLYCIILYCTVLFYVVLYCIVLYCIVLYCYTVLYCVVLCCVVLRLYCAELHCSCTALYCIILCFAMLCCACTALHCIALYCIVCTVLSPETETLGATYCDQKTGKPTWTINNSLSDFVLFISFLDFIHSLVPRAFPFIKGKEALGTRLVVFMCTLGERKIVPFWAF